MGKAGLGGGNIRPGPNAPFAAAIVLRVGFSLGICLILPGAAPDFSSGREKDPGGVRGEAFERRIRREESQLQRLEARIARERDRERQRGGRAKSLLRQLDRLSARLAAEDQRLRLIKRRIAPLERRLEQLNGRLARLRIDRGRTRHKMRRRLQAMYMDGPVAYARLVIMAQSIQDILDRWSWLTNLARSDLRLIRHYRAQEETLRAVEAEAEKEFGRWEGFRNKREKTKRRIAALYGRRSRQLARLEKRKENRATLLRELSEARAELRDAIVSLFRDRDTRLRGGAAAIERLKGLLPWPVEGGAVSPAGGDDEGRGIRIRARGGSPIRVVTRGEVVFSDWIRGYGRMLILRHEGEYYTVYGGAGEVLVEKGEVPPDGSVIARVGATSVLGEPSLYFEIRKGAIPLDPLRWLSSRP